VVPTHRLPRLVLSLTPYFATYSTATDQHTELKLAFLTLSRKPSNSFKKKLAMLALLRLQVQTSRLAVTSKRSRKSCHISDEGKLTHVLACTVDILPLVMISVICTHQRDGNKKSSLHCMSLLRTFRGSYTEPWILMDSIRSPGRLQELYQESTNPPSGVHLESIRTSLKVAATMNATQLHVYST
jgi:hypothetical protein